MILHGMCAMHWGQRWPVFLRCTRSRAFAKKIRKTRGDATKELRPRWPPEFDVCVVRCMKTVKMTTFCPQAWTEKIARGADERGRTQGKFNQTKRREATKLKNYGLAGRRSSSYM